MRTISLRSSKPCFVSLVGWVKVSKFIVLPCAA